MIIENIQNHLTYQNWFLQRKIAFFQNIDYEGVSDYVINILVQVT